MSKSFGKVVVDVTKGNKNRIQFIEAGKASGEFLTPIYVDSLKKSGVELSDLLAAIKFAWGNEIEKPAPKNVEAAEPKTRKKETTLQTAIGNEKQAARQALEYLRQNKKQEAIECAKRAGIPHQARGRGFDKLAEIWMDLAQNGPNNTVLKPEPAKESTPDLLSQLTPEQKTLLLSLLK